MEKMNIPTTIHVGYQNRKDTYTGKLAYVIYTDEKGKKRKESSWNGWRNKDIDPTDYPNEPTSGFVLNKGVGGARQSWGWNARNEYIRVYDPRGFEFEISVANLLFILQECTSTKGKGLEGEFVYAWDGAELVLLPVGCYEYNQSSAFTAAKTLKVTKNDMSEGSVYMHKNMHKMVYLGKHNIREDDSLRDWSGDFRKSLYELPKKPMHAFFDLDEQKYKFERGFTNIAQRDTDTQYPTFADLYSDLVNGQHVSCIDHVALVPIAFTHKDDHKWSCDRALVQTKPGVYSIIKAGRYSYYSRPEISLNVTLDELQNPGFDDAIRGYDQVVRSDLEVFEQSHKQNNLFTIQYVLKSGKKLGVYGYVKPE